MDATPQFVVLMRPERENGGAYGIYAVNEKRWLDIIYKTESEATNALMRLRAYHARSPTSNERLSNVKK